MVDEGTLRTTLSETLGPVTAANLKRDLDKLRQYPALDTLHPGLLKELQALRADAKGFYAVPYSVAFADEMVRSSALLNEAADALEKDDWEFAKYLRNRARDLLSDDYESGDAAWVTGRFKNLNAQGRTAPINVGTSPIANVDAGLVAQATGSISGKVWDDADRDGVWEGSSDRQAGGLISGPVAPITQKRPGSRSGMTWP